MRSPEIQKITRELASAAINIQSKIGPIIEKIFGSGGEGEDGDEDEDEVSATSETSEEIGDEDEEKQV